MVNVDEPQRSTAQVGESVRWTAIGPSLLTSGPYGKGARRKAMWGTQLTYGRRLSGQMIAQFNFLA